MNSNGRHEAAGTAAAGMRGSPDSNSYRPLNGPIRHRGASRSRQPPASGRPLQPPASPPISVKVPPFFTRSPRVASARLSALRGNCTVRTRIRGGTGKGSYTPPPSYPVLESQWKLSVQLRHLSWQLLAGSFQPRILLSSLWQLGGRWARVAEAIEAAGPACGARAQLLWWPFAPGFGSLTRC